MSAKKYPRVKQLPEILWQLLPWKLFKKQIIKKRGEKIQEKMTLNIPVKYKQQAISNKYAIKSEVAK